MSCRNQAHVELKIPEKSKTFINKETAEMEKVFGNISKHSIFESSSQAPFIVFYGFETMIIETDNQLKLEELRKNKDKSFTVKLVSIHQ